MGRGPQGRPAKPGDGGRRPPETAAGGLPCGPDCGFAGGCGGVGGLQVGGKTGVRGSRRVRGAGQGRRPNRPEDGFGGRSPPAPAEPGRPAALSPPAQNGPRSYRNRKTVSAAREWWRRSGRPTTVQGVSAPVRRTVSGTRYFCARLTLRGCSTLAPCSAISSISS